MYLKLKIVSQDAVQLNLNSSEGAGKFPSALGTESVTDGSVGHQIASLVGERRRGGPVRGPSPSSLPV